MTRSGFMLVLALACAPALALDCKNAMTTPDINECASIEQKKIEARLNKVYQRVLKSLDQAEGNNGGNAEMKKKLVAAQRAWVKFREADCDAVFEKHADGSIRTVMYISCMQRRAERRIEDLEIYERE
jgi:uncharacterized protein YecT (DUF1311 family)